MSKPFLWMVIAYVFARMMDQVGREDTPGPSRIFAGIGLLAALVCALSLFIADR